MAAKFTEKQRAFVSEYPVDLNATQAAIRAGYSPKTAYSQGQRLLKNVEITNAIAVKQKQSAKRNETDVDMIDKMHKSAFQEAKKNGQASAMTAAAKNLADLHGLAKNKQSIDHTSSDGSMAHSPTVIELVAPK